MEHTPGWERAGRPLLIATAVVFAGAARIVPTRSTDWALAAAILVAAVVQAEITRRTRTGGSPAAWMIAAAVAVHLTLAIALVLVLHAYRCLRDKRGSGDLFDTFAGHACAVIAAHFAASLGAWATPVLQADTRAVLAVAAAVAAWLVADHAVGLLRHSGGFTDLGLTAALLTTGAITGALAPGGFLVVVAAVPVVVMLHGAAVTRQLEDDASVDKKTGLSTAAYWQAGAERVFADGQQAGVLMVDLDHFKRLNDTYGHRAGDDVLAAVGACLRSQLRQSDLAGRFGGEEFTVLLPGADTIDTMAAAERIRATIATLHITTVDKYGRPTVVTDVTASIGAAVCLEHGVTAQECLRVADNRVYQAKQQGRNVVVGPENIIPLQRDR